MADQFKKIFNWNASHRLCKVYAKQDKNGKMYLMGEFTKGFQMTIRELPSNQFTKPGTWEVNLIPINYEKIQPVPSPNIEYGEQDVPY